MRYRKGQISISPERDIPVLRLIRNSRALRTIRLYDLLILLRMEPSRRTSYWRVQRLLTLGLIRTISIQFVGEEIYMITRMGLSLLESHGHCLLSYGSQTKTLLH